MTQTLESPTLATEAMSMDEHVGQFVQDGYTLFPRVFGAAQMELWRQLFRALQGTNKPSHPEFWFGGIFEKAPKELLPAVANPHLLDFAERVMGPFVQLDNISLVGFPSSDAEQARGKVSGWHRDRWAHLPKGGYTHPLAINGITYFQDLDDQYGPLRVIPGSHREPIAISPVEANRPHPREVLLDVRAGDVVFIHNALLHSGTPNISGQTRFFFSLFYNLTWLRPTDDHTGPRTSALIEAAREADDFRTMRLFGVDEKLESRNNWGFNKPDEPEWARWAAEDKASKDAKSKGNHE